MNSFTCTCDVAPPNLCPVHGVPDPFDDLKTKMSEVFDQLDMVLDEVTRIHVIAINSDAPMMAEIAGLCARAMKEIPQKVPVIAQRNEAQRNTLIWKTSARETKSALVAMTAERDQLITNRTRLHAKLIDILHAHGTGETDEKDGEKIDEMVERIVSERDQLRRERDEAKPALLSELEHQISTLTKERDEAVRQRDSIAYALIDASHSIGRVRHKDRGHVCAFRSCCDSIAHKIHNNLKNGGVVQLAFASANDQKAMADLRTELAEVKADIDWLDNNAKIIWWPMPVGSYPMEQNPMAGKKFPLGLRAEIQRARAEKPE